MSSDIGASPKTRCKRTDVLISLGAEVSTFHGYDVKINHQLEKSLVHVLSYSIKKVTQETASGGPQKESRGDNSRGRCGVCWSDCKHGQDAAWTLGAPKQTNSVRSTQDDLHVSGRKKIPQASCVGFIVLVLSSVDPFLMRADSKVLCALQGQPTVQGLVSRPQGPDCVSLLSPIVPFPHPTRPASPHPVLNL